MVARREELAESRQPERQAAAGTAGGVLAAILAALAAEVAAVLEAAGVGLVARALEARGGVGAAEKAQARMAGQQEDSQADQAVGGVAAVRAVSSARAEVGAQAVERVTAAGQARTQNGGSWHRG